MRPPRAVPALALAVGWLAGCGSGDDAGSAAPLPPPHGIVLVVLDTLRADGLSCYGNPRATSPRIDALASRGVLFESVVSNTSWTLPGFVAILTGDHPSARVFRRTLQRSGVTRLREAGYRTAAFTEGGYVSRLFGLDLGFDLFWEETARVIEAPGPDAGIAKTFGKAADWLRESADQPFFLLVHTYETHVPYQRLDLAEGLPAGQLGGMYDGRQNGRVLRGELVVSDVETAWVRALYDGGVAEADRQLGALLDVLTEQGVADRTLVVVTSDHGEQLGEHDPQALGLHGQTLWDTVLAVPLVIHDPRRDDGGRRVAAQVRLVDVMPTILERAGLQPDPAADGRSLLPMMDGRDTADRVAYSELRDRKTGRLKAATLRTPAHKLHLNAPGSSRPNLELFDLRADPGELRDVAAEAAHERAQLHGALQSRVGEIERRGQPWTGRRVADELADRLRALGYAE